MLKTLSDNQRFYLFIGLNIAGLILLMTFAWGAFGVLALSFGLAYLLDPVADYLEGKGVPRTGSVLLIMAAAGIVFLAGLGLAIPYLWEQAVLFIKEAPRLAETALAKAAAFNLLPEEMSRSVPELLDSLKQRLLSGGFGTIKPLVQWLFRATSGTLDALLTVINLVIVPVFFFFFIKEIDAIREGFFRFVPENLRESTRNYLGMVDGVLSGFIRGQVMVALILAVLYATGLGFTGIRFGILIGVVSGLLFIIPYVGTILGIVASAMVLVVDFSGWAQVAGVVATFGIAQTIEGYFLTPRIVGNRVGLTQLEALIAILVGGQMGGFPGLLLGIPVGGILKKTVFFLRPEQDQQREEGEGRPSIPPAEPPETSGAKSAPEGEGEGAEDAPDGEGRGA